MSLAPPSPALHRMGNHSERPSWESVPGLLGCTRSARQGRNGRTACNYGAQNHSAGTYLGGRSPQQGRFRNRRSALPTAYRAWRAYVGRSLPPSLEPPSYPAGRGQSPDSPAVDTFDHPQITPVALVMFPECYSRNAAEVRITVSYASMHGNASQKWADRPSEPGRLCQGEGVRGYTKLFDGSHET
jgi:hypothetical protein